MQYSPDRLDLTLLALLGLTLATMAFAGATRAPVLVDGIVLAIAAIKGRRILLDYLDLRSAPALWRGLATAWLMLIVGFAWVASAVPVLLPSP
jgi:hypothetical protein